MLMVLRFGGGHTDKFWNVPDRCIEGKFHQSSMEARRCTELHLLQIAGEIRDLKAHPQPRLKLEVNGVHIGVYEPDFEYFDLRSDSAVVEDVKGPAGRTKEYELKKRLVLACLGIEVVEVTHVRGARRRRR